MKLSIVIICLNDRDHLERCLRSVNGLDYRGWDLEVIVSDGGSTDDSVEVAERAGARVVRSPRGIPIQRNTGIREATGDVVAQLDADVEVFQEFFDSIDEHYSGGQKLLLGGIKRLPADAHWVTRADTLAWLGAAALYEDGHAESASMAIAGYCVICSREICERVSYRENMPVDEDTLFVYDVEHLGYPIVVDPKLKFIHHGEPKDFVQYVKKAVWNHNYSTWFQRLREGDRAAWRSMNYWWGLLFTAGLLSGALPAAGMVATRALVTAAKNRAPAWLPSLAAMYAGNGLACTASLFGYNKDKSKRWRK